MLGLVTKSLLILFVADTGYVPIQKKIAQCGAANSTKLCTTSGSGTVTLYGQSAKMTLSNSIIPIWDRVGQLFNIRESVQLFCVENCNHVQGG